MAKRYRLPLFTTRIGLPTGSKEAASDGWFYPVNAAEESALVEAGCEADELNDPVRNDGTLRPDEVSQLRDLVPTSDLARLANSPVTSSLGVALLQAAGAPPSEDASVPLLATPPSIAQAASSALISGWGSLYQFNSTISSFDAIFVPLGITQPAGMTLAQRWARLVLTVRSGSITGPVLATATVHLAAYVSPTSPLTFELSAKVSRESAGSDYYYVSVEALTASGARAPCGWTGGSVLGVTTLPNWVRYVPGTTNEAASYQLTSNGTWVTVTGGPTVYGMAFIPARRPTERAALAPQASVGVLNVPPRIYAVVGRECNLYFDGVVRGRYSALDWDVECAIGTQQAERWTAIPVASGNQALTLSSVDPITQGVLRSASTTVQTADAAAPFTAQLLPIGDSTTAAGMTTQELLTLDAADSATSLTLLGTQGTAPNSHEGRSGWTATMFTTNGSPFWIGGVVDVPGYITANGYTGMTHAIVDLGINDIFAATSDAALNTAITTHLSALSQIIQGIQAYSATIKIGICLTIPPSASQDAFGKNYASGQTRSRYRRNWFELVRRVLASFAAGAPSNVFILPTNVCLDTERNMNTESVAANARNATSITRQSNGVHPAASGYYQKADVVWAWLKNNP